MGICTWDCPLTFTWKHVCGRMSFSIYLGMGNLKQCYFSSIYSTSLSHAGNSGCLSLVRLQLLQEQRYPLLPVCAVFLCVRQWHVCQCLGYLTCAPMLMHAIAGRGCTKTMRESAVKADHGHKKSVVALGKGNLCQWGQGSNN